MPDWWVWASGVTFILSIVLNLVLMLAVYLVLKAVLPLVNDVKTKVDTITTKVDGIATNVKSTVDTVHSKTTQILGSAEEASAEVTRKVGAASAAITAIFVVTRLVGALRGMQQEHAHAPAPRTVRPLKPAKVKVVKN
jgi:citrate synthase